MKKALRITGICLISFLGLVLIAASIAIAIIGSPKQLTQMVNNYAPQFVDCEMQMGKADLTIFKTFPEVGVEIEEVTLINPLVGSPSDTLAYIGKLIVVIDAKKFRNEDEIVVRKCILEDATVNLFTDSVGKSNFNVLKMRNANDSTSTSFDYLVDIEEVKLRHTTLRLTDDRHQTTTQTDGLNLDLKGQFKDKDIVANLVLKATNFNMRTTALQVATTALNLNFDGNISQFDQIEGLLRLDTPDITLNLDKPYLQNDTLNLYLPLQLRLSDKKMHLNLAQIGINSYLIDVNGYTEIAKNGDVNLNLDVKTNTLQIDEIINYLPEKTRRNIGMFTLAGEIKIAEASVEGIYNDNLRPMISAKVLTDNARVGISKLPYPFTALNLDAQLNLDLTENIGSVAVNKLSAKYHHSHLSAKGLVGVLLGDIRLKLNINGNIPMSDMNCFLPKNMELCGHSIVKLNTNFTVKQLMKTFGDYDLNRLHANANVSIMDFNFNMDTLHANTPLLNVDLVLPTHLSINSKALDAQIGKSKNVTILNPEIELRADHFSPVFNKTSLNSRLKSSELNIVYDSVYAKLKSSVINFVTLPESEKDLNAHIILDGEALEAQTGKTYTIDAHSLKIDASIKQDKAKHDFLDRWNPIADILIGNAVVQMDGISEKIHIDNIDLLFNSHELDFNKSTFRIGESDLSLHGNVTGIKEWMVDHKNNLMKGEWQLSSEMLNINEIMDLTSGLGRSDVSKTTEKAGAQEDNPFMVPEGIDFTFDIRTKRSLFKNFDLNDLSGGLTIKDGTLVLQEIGFTNKAAEMLLTAMYQSPRKNNLILAMDFHLLDVQINDLLQMIPFIDTLVPMLKTFDGQAEFHIGAETNLRSNYQPKISTLRAAADIEGRNLTVKDQFTFNNIAEKLKISSEGEYRVDSLNLQLTAFKDEIDLWPSQIAIRDYKVTVDGRMNLDTNGEYHLTVTETPIFLPNRMGLKLSGPINNISYELEKPKYPNLYKPNKRNDLEEMYLELKQRIADQLKADLK